MSELPNLQNLSITDTVPNTYYKPFLKWAGGKTQLLNKLIPKFPKKLKDYYEPFVGAGSVMFALLYKIASKKIILTGKIYVYDINKPLINLYKNIQNNPSQLSELLNSHMKIYDECNGESIIRNPSTIQEAKTSKESYYYWLRKRFNQLEDNNIEKSALFLIINKLCFRGLYREGPNGFNVPFGHYKKTPHIHSKDEILIISKIIKDVSFECLSYTETIPKVTKGSFVYLDPPYVPVKKTSFVNYNVDGFTKENHLELFNLVKKLKVKKIKFILCNSKVSLVEEIFTKPTYKIEEIECKRAINSKNPEATQMELIIWN